MLVLLIQSLSQIISIAYIKSIKVETLKTRRSDKLIKHTNKLVLLVLKGLSDNVIYCLERCPLLKERKVYKEMGK